MTTKYRPTEDSTTETKLIYLIEECAEATQAATKSLRWGLDSVNPELPVYLQETNAEWLKREVKDIEYAIELLKKAGIV